MLTLKSEKSEKKSSDTQESEGLKQLLKTRTILISAAVDAELAQKVIQQLFWLESSQPKKEIRIFINSPGGEIHSGFAIYDCLNFISCPVVTVVAGLAASMGSILSLAGDKGSRFALPYARFMLHQPLLGGYSAPATDIDIQSKEMIKTKDLIGKIYAEKTSQSLSKIMSDIDRDYWLTAQEALDYGLIDKVIKNRRDLPIL